METLRPANEHALPQQRFHNCPAPEAATLSGFFLKKKPLAKDR